MGMRASIVGGSGYVGGELIRLLLQHPEIDLHQVISSSYAGKPLWVPHPNLRSQTGLTFSCLEDLAETDILFMALPHGEFMHTFEQYRKISPRIIDLSADFRLASPRDYEKWYGYSHPYPHLLGEFVYGIVELHRHELTQTRYISGPGCNATAVILAINPLIRSGYADPDFPVVVEAKCGSSEGGSAVSAASHHPERSGCVRSYKPTGHRHTAEMVQELSHMVWFSATAVEMVRGILVTAHLKMSGEITEMELWRIYRDHYGKEPFIRLINQKSGAYRYPEPKLLAGTNFCDIGFSVEGDHVVVMGALDNLMKGAAGQAVHAMNVMCGFTETAGLDFGGLHPV
ncbi:MAG: N-acetyl-gamma-glutamyl-phosphate reductase [Theionarchaea archaeon]|nr:N-acetyl-gamma-glutamyl-phosphate reductase [Theionarchaea archaeon]